MKWNEQQLLSILPQRLRREDYREVRELRLRLGQKPRLDIPGGFRELEGTVTGEELRFVLTADGFLYHMVRIIVGTLLEIGLGLREPESIPAIFRGRDRSLAGETAAPEGLCLQEVRYTEKALLPEEVCDMIG